MQNYATLHLYENGEAGLVKLVYIVSIVAIFILIIACVNFMNLSTARSKKRSLEVGIRKVNGARRKQLMLQFLGESVFTVLLATMIAMLIVELTLSSFNNFTGVQLAFWDGNVIKFIESIFVLILFVGIFAGIYPAFILSSFKPVSVLKGNGIHLFSRGALFRKVLIIGQFIISISLIICALIVKEQMDFVSKADLGMDRNRVVTLPNNIELTRKFDSYKSNLLLNTGIVDASASATQPFDVNQRIPINWEGHMNEEAVDMRYTMIDYDFFKTMGMKIIRGRAFSPVFSTDSTRAVIINESAATLMGFKNPVGKTVYFGHPAFPEDKREVKIVGVVKDFHFLSLHSLMGPFIFRMYRPWCSNIFIKLSPGDIQRTLAGIETITKKFAPDYPFQYEFLDDTYNRLYIMETKTSQLINIFSILAVIISCLGLFGLAAYTAEQKTKEVGIRKVLGSSVSQIVLLLSKEFIKWVALANLVAWPIAYYVMYNWLKDFAYKINISPWIFLFACIITLLIALLTVSSLAIKAATANPVESLRYE